MINYPLTPAEARVVDWTGRVMTLMATATLCAMGALAL